MSEHHPLDVDLADLVDGVLDAGRTERVEAHLDGCLLCRRKRRRLEATPAPAPGEGPSGPWSGVEGPSGPWSGVEGPSGPGSGVAGPSGPGSGVAGPLLPAPAFVVPRLESGGAPAVDDLWLAGDLDAGAGGVPWPAGGDRLLVLVRAVAGDRVTVAPVTFDVEAADDETVVVEESPFRTAVAVHPALATEIPRAALTARVGSLTPAGRPGTPIAGGGDPRLQVRQHLADALAAFAEPAPPAEAGGPPPRPEEVRSALIADLRAMRGRACTVRSLDGWGDLVLAEARGWRPLATVDEVGVVLVVLDTPHGLDGESDFDAARSVLTRRNASALVVTTTALSELADVFDAAALHAGIEMPSGAAGPPRPLISGLAPFDAIAKYLDQHSGAGGRAGVAGPSGPGSGMAGPARGMLAPVQVLDVLRQAAAEATAGAARQGGRFKIAPKRRGYESLAGEEQALAAALEQAFAGGSVVEALLGRSDE